MKTKNCQVCGCEFTCKFAYGRPRKLCYDPQCRVQYKKEHKRNSRWEKSSALEWESTNGRN